MKLQGNSTVNFALEMLTFLSSWGWRITSSAARLNSGSSSRKSTPLWAREISPGRGLVPPPTRATSEMLWWGARKGLVVIRAFRLVIFPATEWMRVVSRDSDRVSGGSMVGSLLASMVLPAPGGPIRMRLERQILLCSFLSVW